MRKKEVVIIGCGRFGGTVIEQLSLISGYNIIAVDKQENSIKRIQNLGIKEGIIADVTDDGKLKELGLLNSDIYIIGVGDNIEASLLISNLVKTNVTKKNARIICKAVSTQQENILKGMGITEIINPETQAAKRAVQKITNPLLYNFVTEEVAELPGGVSMIKILTPEILDGKVVKNLGTPGNVLISIVYRNKKAVIVNGDTKLQAGELMVVVGDSKKLISFFSQFRNKKIE